MNDEPESGKRRRRVRRRRDRRSDHRTFYQLLPQLLTTGNLAAGFYSITLSAAGDLDRAALAIVFAVLFDIFDGRMARLAGTTSHFGSEYDSIADTVSFGVAPAMLAYSAGALQELGWTGWVLAFLYAACAALRLARFNVTPARYPGRFEGLPSPAAAGMVLSSVWFSGFLSEGGLPLGVPASLAGIGVAMVGLLMVSPIPYRSFKEIRLPRTQSSAVLMVLIFAVMLSKPSVTFFAFGVLYVGSGPAEWWWRWRTGRTLEELPSTPSSSAGENAQEGTP